MRLCICLVLAAALLSPLGVSAEELSVKIALCQIFSLDGDREGNFARIEAAIQEATQEKAEIVCFPETCLLGWVNPSAHERAFEIPGKDSGRLAKLAQKYNVFLCIGLAEKEGEKLYDSAILLDNDGKILLKHRKINVLTELMAPPYTPGTEVQVAETRFGRIGVMICADSFEKSVVDRMGKLKPDLVLIPYGWAAGEDKWPEHGKSLEAFVRHAARTMDAVVIGTDLVGEISHGPWRGLVYGGQSVASTATGDVLAVGKDRQRDILVVSVEYHADTN